MAEENSGFQDFTSNTEKSGKPYYYMKSIFWNKSRSTYCWFICITYDSNYFFLMGSHEV